MPVDVIDLSLEAFNLPILFFINFLRFAIFYIFKFPSPVFAFFIFWIFTFLIPLSLAALDVLGG